MDRPASRPSRRKPRPEEKLVIRRARPSDREAILEMSKTIWGGDDYLPLVWDRWIADKKGAFLTVLHDGRPIGTSKVSVLAPGEVWLEGLRLHRDYHGRGLSRQIHGATFREAMKLRPKSVRYSTWIGNEASRHIAETHGFWQIAGTSWMWGRARNRKLRSRRPTAGDIDEIVRYVRSSECYRETSGVMGVGWKFPGLTRRRIGRLLRDGFALVLPRRGAIRAVALFDIGQVDDDLCLGYIDGSDGDIAVLARDVLAVARQSGRKDASAMVPEGRIADTVFRSGFDAEHPFQAVVYELGARGTKGSREPFELKLARTLRASEAALTDLVAEFLLERSPAGLSKENVRDYLRRKVLPDTRRAMTASLLRLENILTDEEPRSALYAVAMHLHTAHGLSGEAIEFLPNGFRVRHLGRTLAVVRCSGPRVTMKLGPGFGPCFPADASFAAERIRFPKGGPDPKTGLHESLTLTLTRKSHAAGAIAAIDTIVAAARGR